MTAMESRRLEPSLHLVGDLSIEIGEKEKAHQPTSPPYAHTILSTQLFPPFPYVGGRARLFRLGEKLVAPLIAVLHVDRTDERHKKERQMQRQL
jgi:hypothetical protein